MLKILPSPHLLSSRRWSGMNVGLLGGSFNPPHEGHMHIARTALRQHNLDAIWWLVAPQNPLKHQSNNFEKRFELTQKFVCHPRMIVTSIETDLNTQYSFQTVAKLQKRFPKTNFTWIAGMDNACIFHKWDRWRDLIRTIPFIFFNRPPNGIALTTNVIRLYKGRKNVKFSLYGKTRNISSTALRKKKFARFLKFGV